MLEHRELLSKHEILEGKLALVTERRSQRSNDNPDPLEHAQRLAGPLRKRQ